ncbi:MAG: hypothetical protein OSJ71_17205 [Acetatifactor sp.]|nr:hypothetical protein [Acetatifactor sp.]
MEHGGFRPEEIDALSPDERTVWQAVAELNREQRREDIRDAVAEAIADVLRGLMKK